MNAEHAALMQAFAKLAEELRVKNEELRQANLRLADLHLEFDRLNRNARCTPQCNGFKPKD